MTADCIKSGIMASVSIIAFAFMLLVAMATAYPVHREKMTNHDLIKAIRDKDGMEDKNGAIVYYWNKGPDWLEEDQNNEDAMRNDDDGREAQNGALHSIFLE